MFDRIAHRYDLLNHGLSAGQDWRWRAHLAQQLQAVPHGDVLDLATGTADQLLALARRCPGLQRGLGVDLSLGMLQRGQPKLPVEPGRPHLLLVHGDAQHLPLRSASVAAVTISFGIRNVADIRAGLAEMYRVLRPGGHLFILEFGLPGSRLARQLYLLYFRHVLPRLGAILSGDSHAYRYLNQTVETFPYGEAFCAQLRAAGFTTVDAMAMTMGVVYLYRGQRPTS